MSTPRDATIARVHRILISHDAERPTGRRSSECMCGLVVPLAHPFQAHVAEEVVDAVLAELNVAFAPLKGTAT